MKKQQTLLACFSCFFLLSFSTVLGQIQDSQKTLSMNTQFEIDFSNVMDKKVSSTYTIDVSNLNFKSATVLDKFCEQFSLDFHVFHGDFETGTISIDLDKALIKKRKYSMDFIERHFRDISGRMLYMFNKLNI